MEVLKSKQQKSKREEKNCCLLVLVLPRPTFVNPNRCFLFSEFVKTKSIPCLQNSMVFDVSSDACLVRRMLVWQSRRWVPGYYWLQHKCILVTSSDEPVYYNLIHLCFSEPFEEIFIAYSKTDWYGYQDLDRQWWFVGYVCSGFALPNPIATISPVCFDASMCVTSSETCNFWHWLSCGIIWKWWSSCKCLEQVRGFLASVWRATCWVRLISCISSSKARQEMGTSGGQGPIFSLEASICASK